MVLKTSISLDKAIFTQDETIRGHVDIDTNEYQPPLDGHREEYVCKFKVWGVFSFQEPHFRKSALLKLKRKNAANWQSSQVDSTLSEFEVDSRDCPYLLKPGQVTRVRSIPFSFRMSRPNVPGSFTSRHGRAKLEYLVSATTIGKHAKQTTSATFTLLPSPVISVGICQHNFNVDIDAGGATVPLTVPDRNIITIAYPTHFLPGSLQNLTITFPDQTYSLQDVSLTLHTRLSVHAIKRTFTIEEEDEVIPSTVTDDDSVTKILSMQTPAEIAESFTVSLKRSVVRKSETLQILFSYSKDKVSGSPAYCTSSCELPILIATGTASQSDLTSPSALSAIYLSTPEANSQISERSHHKTRSQQSRNTLVCADDATNTMEYQRRPESRTSEPVKRSTVRVLKGILKKPRRFSKDKDILIVESTSATQEEASDQNEEGVVPQISTAHSDEERSESTDANKTSTPENAEPPGSSHHLTHRGALQLPEFDRMLFAIRGAQLRDEYLRDNRCKSLNL